jgi:hypothetical protein
MIYINKHEIVLDSHERLESWTSFDHVIRLAMDFIKHCPVDPLNDMPWYLQYSCFWIDPLRPTIWPDNPAGKFSWAVTTLLKYYPYSGDSSFISIVKTMLDRLWDNRTPEHFAWGGIPYASAQPGTGNYFGARADGEYVTEPDKVAQAGKAFLDFYQISSDKRYLQIGKHCAEIIVKNLRKGDSNHSPLPFRIDVRKGKIIEEYTSHMIPVVRLFDDLIRLGENSYKFHRDEIWEWIDKYPLKNNLWKGHFEDIRLDPDNENRDQLSPMETARYILQNKDEIPEWRAIVKGLINWVINNLGGHIFYSALPIHEQKFCFFPMGSHTARFASICATYAHESGESNYKELARRSFNWASYMANEDGTVTVGIDRPDYYNQCWFTDGYFDFVPHFIDGMAYQPEFAPGDSDHMLLSTTVVQEIEYRPFYISYRTFDPEGVQTFRLTFKPTQIQADGIVIPEKSKEEESCWVFNPEINLLKVKPGSKEVVIQGR